jgi:hypothetical protein
MLLVVVRGLLSNYCTHHPSSAFSSPSLSGNGGKQIQSGLAVLEWPLPRFGDVWDTSSSGILLLGIAVLVLSMLLAAPVLILLSFGVRARSALPDRLPRLRLGIYLA